MNNFKQFATVSLAMFVILVGLSIVILLIPWIVWFGEIAFSFFDPLFFDKWVDKYFKWCLEVQHKLGRKS